MNNTDPDMKDNNKGESSEVNIQELEKRLNLSIVAMIKSPTVTTIIENKLPPIQVSIEQLLTSKRKSKELHTEVSSLLKTKLSLLNVLA